MSSRFRHVALIGKYQASGARAQCGAQDDVMEGIGAFLESQGCKVFVEKSQAHPVETGPYPALTVEEIGQQCDLGLVVGGDGTMLGIGRQLAPHDVPLIGINRGRLGFITDISLDNYQATLIPMLAGEYEEDLRTLMQAKVIRDGQSVFDTLAMNDVVVNRGATSGMVELRVTVGRHFVANQRADGMIISTPTGSTAYALSAGGPLLHPAVRGWVLVPIAPHTLSNRPLLLPDADEVTMELVGGRDASANFDMQSLASLVIGDQVMVRRSDYRVRFLHPRGWSYFDTLRKKLHWNEGGS
ncbi:NAD kinase [Variovorax saccharolyticus]|uniref:NAD kinase n=1 Tax=Variovorax saccharolyticus TaxID=3053516 RepID=UPI002574FA54|nr:MULTISPECIES: NAD kinase [unclassified Variovorax]MDM0020656.1 NAD kinase [Variovorax sp. J22R187]MDM0025785.1 NAD kinase [Variovorax sp. J31P216]